MVATNKMAARRRVTADVTMSAIDEVCEKVVKLYSDNRDLAHSRYYIDVPYRFAGGRGVRRFPPKGVSLYTFDEAVYVLAIFNKRWLRKGTFPPPELEPKAVKAKKREDAANNEFTFRCLLSPEHMSILFSSVSSEEESVDEEEV